MKNSESLNEFKKLNSEQITEKIDQLRKDLFDLRFKQATRQLNETHKFKIINAVSSTSNSVSLSNISQLMEWLNRFQVLFEIYILKLMVKKTLNFVHFLNKSY